MKITGTIIKILPEKSGRSANGEWRKQEYVLETIVSYPKKICFIVWGDKISEFKLKQGETVQVDIDLESREYNGRWFTDVKAQKVTREAFSLNHVVKNTDKHFSKTESKNSYSTDTGRIAIKEKSEETKTRNSGNELNSSIDARSSTKSNLPLSQQAARVQVKPKHNMQKSAKSNPATKIDHSQIPGSGIAEKPKPYARKVFEPLGTREDYKKDRASWKKGGL